MSAPLVVSFGGGVDSTAMLIEMHRRGIRPDLILFADTKAEKSATYRHIERFSQWLVHHGFPQVTTVSYDPPIAPYGDLEGNCLSNDTLPSLAFGRKSCSLKWKVKPQHDYLKNWTPAIEAWESGDKVKRAIGYDDSKGDHNRATSIKWAIGLDDGGRDQKRATTYAGAGTDADKFDYWYPLQEWHMDRHQCEWVITMAGLSVPPKSSCFFCPAMKKPEIISLAKTDPELLDRAIEMEDNYLVGKHHAGRLAAGKKCSTVGLGRRVNWRQFAEDEGLINKKKESAK